MSGVLLVALALRDRYPRVQGLFTEGLIDYPMVRLFVQRASAIIDPQTWAALDDKVAEMLAGGEPMSQHTAQKAIDGLIWELDPCAVHRSQTRARNRHVDVLVDDETGVAQLAGNLLATAGHALNARLDAFAATVCPHDPRTKDQRRADAVLPLSNGADRLGCQCNREDCLAALRPPSTGVMIHLVAHDDTITGPTQPTETTTPKPDPNPETETESEPESDCASGDPDTNADADGAPRDAESEPETDLASPAPIAPAPVEECAGLDGPQPPILTTPLRELTLAEVANHLTPIPRQLSTIAPAIIVGGGVLPGAIARRAAHGATRSVIVHPGQAPPEPRYRPSAKLVEFIRCRDLTCRLPGLQSPSHRLRRGPYDSMALRADRGVEPEVPLPKPPPAQDVLGAVIAAGGTNNCPTAPSSGRTPTGAPTPPNRATASCSPACAHRPRPSSRRAPHHPGTPPG